MTDAMWADAERLWRHGIPGWAIADHFAVSISCIYRRACEQDWPNRDAYEDRRIQPDRRANHDGGRRATDPLMRCQACQQVYRGHHTCAWMRGAG